ncbi:MAG: TPM domain-containing protein [Candidatus Solibacter usitatus]|nr:TPM domain-containing protein [Candidatus Solibacter usitatus]
MKTLRRLALATLCYVSAACAVDWKALKPQGYVSDFANVVDARSRAALERYCARVEQLTQAQMALVTISTLDGEPIEDVTNTIYRAWGVGQKGKNEGIMLLLVVRDRRSRLEIGYGLEPILPDGLSGDILREMRPALRQNQYGTAMIAAAQHIGSIIAKSKNVSLDVELPRRVTSRPRDSIPWPLLIGGLVILLWLMRAGGGAGGGGGFGGFLTGMMLGNMMNGGRGSGWGGGGGGFGGGGGGGGFGGFGGGDSGGGGASSDW